MGLGCGKQALGVVVLRIGQNAPRRFNFANKAITKHDDAVGHLRNDREIVGDIDRGSSALLDRLLEHAQHLDLRRHVQRRGRLVEDDKLRICNERHGGEQSLQLAA
ncbi:hypothetical protein [Bradyrhizobium sp. 131]|uniref:hypothetical protein n=1 Tax=Bradyrhizobium sp. 131 TaxID=2782609 RepID=UPI001FFEC261|nr:hypothetical protein [Bradyrhizobium sp. 131]